MKRSFLFSVLLLSVISLQGQKTEIQYLSGTDKDNTVKWEFFCNNGMNSGKWSAINVPSNWELQGFGSYLYGNVNRKINETGMYKYEFQVPSGWQKKKINIVFEGSMTDTEVKINGKPAGPVHQGSFYRFKYDISALLNYGAKNLLEVTVTKESANESINRAERISDFWVFGGIFRPVYLEALPIQYIDRVAINAKADGSFNMDVYTGGKGKAKTVTANVQTLDGKPFGDPLTAKISPDSSAKAVIRGSFSNPALWNPEFPNRYQVVITLNNGKKVIHRMTQKFGFRTVELRPADGIYVNNQKIMFRGVCRHTFWPESGRASSKQLAIDDVNLMKDMNMNSVRMSHYPPDQFFLDVCDSLGMFVLDELAGWQKFYDTPTAKRLIRQMVERDVNHPCIVLWDNGNEGGFNKEVRGDYGLYDPQKRTVIEPWAILNGTNTKHYPQYKYVDNVLNNNKEIYFPTEFLHGLNDGGHGAGLDDYWNLMTSKPLAAGGFLWVFADEGVVRHDLNDSIDTDGNRAPDGIVGPHHEKEGSFYTIKEIWAPVHFRDMEITPAFTGKFDIQNRYIYTNLKLCSYSYDLVKFSKGLSTSVDKKSGTIKAPDLAPGSNGTLAPDLPSDWRNYDVLYITAKDQYGRHINTWSWKITGAEAMASRIAKPGSEKVQATETGNILTVKTGTTEISFDKTSGAVKEIKNNGQAISLTSGNLFTGINRSFTGIKNYSRDNNYVIEIQYDSATYANWTVMGGGWLKLDYAYETKASCDYAGITFSYPESLVTGATLMSNGPYHVWKNRLKGTQFMVFDKKYNNSVTGQTWEYPEFKGYYSNFHAVEVKTKEQPITIVSATEDLFLHLFTPAKAGNLRGVRGEVDPAFPNGNLSVLNGIPGIGTKFSRAENEGPQGQKNRLNGKQTGTLYFRFGK